MNRKIITYLFLFYSLFIVYNTLIPFTFNYYSWQDLETQIHEIEWRPLVGKGRASLTDVVGNIILFVPFGFLLSMWLYYTGSSHPILWSVFTSAALSFSIEFLQLFIQVRDTSPNDFVNNILGGCLGALFATIYFITLSSFVGKIFYDLLNRKPFLLLVIIMGLSQFVAALMPFTVSITASDLKASIKTTNLAPFAYQSVGKLFFNSPNRYDGSPFDYTAFVEGLIFWTAITYVWALCYRIYWEDKPYGKLLLVGLPVVYFPLIEFAQLFISSRVADINDIICGYLGFGLGTVLNYLLDSVRNKTCRTALDLLKIPLLIYGGFILFSGLQPFNWTFSSEVISKDLKIENLILFNAYFRNTSLWNIYDLMASILSFVPISLYWAYRLREKKYSWVGIYFLTTFSALLLGTLIEISQIFSPSRVADITDAFAYGLGGFIGTFLIYYYEQIRLLWRTGYSFQDVSL